MTAAEQRWAHPDPARLRVPAQLARLAEVRRFVRAAARELGADDPTTAALVQAVDESVANVIIHGYRGRDGEVGVEIALESDAVIVARIRDGCPLFDPTTVPDPDLELPLERRRIGGLGVYLARSLVDQVRHRSMPAGGNELELAIRIDAPERRSSRWT